MTVDDDQLVKEAIERERERCARIVGLYAEYEDVSIGLVGMRVCIELEQLVRGEFDMLRKPKPGLCAHIERHLAARREGK